MQWLICYDINDAKRRRNAMKILRSGSLGYQKSGFEHGLTESPEAVLKDLSHWITEEDKLLILPRHSAAPNWHLGQGNCTTENLFIIFN